MGPPVLCEDRGLTQREDDLPVQKLIAERRVDALHVTILPWARWFDEGAQRVDGFNSVAHGLCDGLSSVACREALREAPRLRGACELVDHAQHSIDLAVVIAVLDKVVRQNVVRAQRPEPHARAVRESWPAALGLFHGDFQPFTPPYAIDPLDVHGPSLRAKQSRDPAIAVAAVLLSEADDRRRQRVFVRSTERLGALGRAALADHAAGAAFGDAQLAHRVADARTATRRA